MPEMDRISYGNGSYSKVSVKNDTEYEMTVYYSGNNYSDRLVINSRGTRSLRLPNDSYRISANVNASNVRPYVGSEKLEGGEYASSFYISSSKY